MMALAVAIASLLLAAVACFTFLENLKIYLPAPAGGTSDLASPAISVLIPARNEEANILAAVQSALDAAGGEERVRVLVADDHSTDRTAELVAELAKRDGRVALISVPPLPAGWNGKQHACFVLAQAAQTEWLLFMDADVRMEPGSIARMRAELERSGASLISGVPRQICGSWMEELLIPLIHFVLLAYLPMGRMRRSTSAAYAAGCGQLFLCHAEDYRKAGGHAAIRSSMHDGITLPRAFRMAGLKSDLFDATEVARCRMYADGRQVLDGLGKNAIEGLAKPSRIWIFSLLFLLGQILPLPLALVAGMRHRWLVCALAGVATILMYVPRWAAVKRFRQPLWSALAHPVGVLALTLIQWRALVRHLAGTQAAWKGRSYGDPAADAVGSAGSGSG
jgi:glycosyltransferase involved in cell wall biosynthesis